MDLRDSLRAVRKNWWIVLTALLIATVTAGVITVQSTPRYATTMTFFVTTPGSGVSESYQGGLYSLQRVKSYTDLLSSDRLARTVVEKHHIDLSPAEVADRVSARVVPDSVLLDTTVTDEYASRSRQIAQALATEFASLVSTLETPPGSNTPVVKVEVVAGPSTSPDPVSPKPVRNLSLGVLLGLVLGLGAAVLRETLDTTVKTVDALKEISTAPVLGTIPVDPQGKRAPLIVAETSHSARAEAFRRLRTNMQYVDVDHPVRCLAVTSAVPNEGKSTTACNLAIAFAEAGHTVVLVEADLRRPQLTEYLNLDGTVGLTNVLAGQVELAHAVQPWGDSRLSVLSSGFIPPNPSELLGSQNMADLLKRLTDQYQVVILDTPPLEPVTDGAVVASLADGAMLVARCARTHASQVHAAAQALRAADARLLGCVLNMAPGRTRSYSYSYYYENAPQRRRLARTLGRLSPAPAAPTHRGGRGALASDTLAEDTCPGDTPPGAVHATTAPASATPAPAPAPPPANEDASTPALTEQFRTPRNRVEASPTGPARDSDAGAAAVSASARDTP